METSTLEVRVTRLDTFGFDNVGFIKIDLEGGEEQVIEGVQQTIGRNRPNLLAEMVGDHTQEDSAGRIRKIKQRFGYDAWIFVGKTKLDAFPALRDCAATLRTRNVVFTPKPVG